MNCEQAMPLIARLADGDDAPGTIDRDALDRHLASCSSCAAALDAQRTVVDTLRRREPARVSPGFSARVSARLDQADAVGFLDAIDWRRWAAGFAPIAAALVLAAYLGIGTATTDTSSEAGTASFDTWRASVTAGTPAEVFLEPDSSSDALLETILTGAVPATSGNPQ